MLFSRLHLNLTFFTGPNRRCSFQSFFCIWAQGIRRHCSWLFIYIQQEANHKSLYNCKHTQHNESQDIVPDPSFTYSKKPIIKQFTEPRNSGYKRPVSLILAVSLFIHPLSLCRTYTSFPPAMKVHFHCHFCVLSSSMTWYWKPHRTSHSFNNQAWG